MHDALSPVIWKLTMEWATSTLLCVLALFLFTEAKEPQLLDSGLKIDFLTEPKECDNPVKMGDVVTIDYEGLPHIVHFKTNLVLWRIFWRWLRDSRHTKGYIRVPSWYQRRDRGLGPGGPGHVWGGEEETHHPPTPCLRLQGGWSYCARLDNIIYLLII